jgi:mannosyltransferase
MRDAGAPGADAPPSEGSDAAEAPSRATPEIVAVALVAIAVGLVLRVVTRSALWLDEALSVNIAELQLGELTEALRHDGHPPLYYVLLHGWMELFGQDDLAVRALSGLFGALTLPVAWAYGRRRGGPLLAWTFTAVLALSPYALRYSTETRMYSLVVLLVVLGALLLDDIVVRGRDGWGRMAAAALLCAALLYTHYWSIWLLGAVALGLLWRWWSDRSAATRRLTLRVLGAMVAGGVLFLPWAPTMLYQSANTGTPWAGPVRPTTVLAYTLIDFTSGGFPDAGFIAIVVSVVALLGVFGRGVDARTIRLDLRSVPRFRPEALVAAAALGLGVAFTYLTWSAFATRYAAIVLPLFFVLVGAGLTRFVGRWVRFGAFVVVLALLSMGAIFNVRDGRTQARQFAEAIEEVGQPGDLVLYCPDQLGVAASRELGDGFDQAVYPTFGSPERVDWVDYADRNAAADPDAFAADALARAGSNAVFVVWNGSYKTFEGQCERLVAALAAARPAQELVADGGGTYFEHGTVTWLPRL